jgi:hypothetical protein
MIITRHIVASAGSDQLHLWKIIITLDRGKTTARGQKFVQQSAGII